MFRRFLIAVFLLLVAVTAVAGIVGWEYVQVWDADVTERFRTYRWSFPSKVYSDSLMLYPGMDVDAGDLKSQLDSLGYHATDQPVARKGEYFVDKTKSAIELFVNDLPYRSLEKAGRAVRLGLSGSVIDHITDTKTGEELFNLELGGALISGLFKDVWEERRVVTLDEVSPLLLRAIIDVEDQRFYEHHGIDPVGIARAVVVNFRSGRTSQGGSTLTQQLMKNLFLSSERSVRRKLYEAAMALIVEYRFSKEEILERYINEIYLGQRGAQGVFGVWEASRFYFSKEPSELTIGEMAMISALISSPNRRSPFRNPERAREHRNFALVKMLEQGDITGEQFQVAVKEPLPTAPPSLKTNSAPYFADFVRKELEQTYPAATLTGEGLTIHTSLDPYLQVVAEEAVESGLAELEKKYPRLKSDDPKNKLQACLIAIQPQTGAIRAMIGGRSYGNTQFNRCTQGRRQPGSVFKPFTFLAAFEQTRDSASPVLPTTRIEDTPFTWTFDRQRQSWTPANYKKQYYGTVTARKALEKSLNAATTRLAHQVGLAPILDMARRMGIESPLPPYPSVILGSAEVTPFEVSRAFSVLANEGLRAVPLSIRKVLDRQGSPIERRPVEVEQVISPETAFLVTHLMEGVLDRGTARRARTMGFDRPAAGKTGTTDDYRDAWFVGFTPDLLAVVWVGFDHRTDLRLAGGEAALPLWVEFMKKATADQAPMPFTPPPGIAMANIDPASGQLATSACPEQMEEAFYEGQQPIGYCPLHSAGHFGEELPQPTAGDASDAAPADPAILN